MNPAEILRRARAVTVLTALKAAPPPQAPASEVIRDNRPPSGAAYNGLSWCPACDVGWARGAGGACWNCGHDYAPP